MRLLRKIPVVSACALVASVLMCPGQSATFTSQAIADAYVTTGADGSLSSSNFGAAGALAVSASGLPQGEFQSVIKFSLAGATSSFNTQFGAGQWMIDSVTLQLTAAPHGNSIFNNVAAGQFAVSLMQNNSWVEGAGNGGTPTSDGISFDSLENTYINNALDQPLGVYEFGGNTIGANSYTLGLSSQLVADALSGGNVSLRLFAADSNVSYLFDSRTGGSTAFHPMITVDASVVPEPGSVSLCAAALGILPLLQWRRRWMRRQR